MRLFDKVLVAGFIAVVLLYFTNTNTSPGPDPGPTPGPGVARVLIEYESQPTPPYLTEQFRALQTARTGDVQAWMQTNCKDYHVLDKDQDVSKLEKFWQDAVTAAKAKPLPNVSTYNGRRWTVKQKVIADTSDIKKSIGMK